MWPNSYFLGQLRNELGATVELDELQARRNALLPYRSNDEPICCLKANGLLAGLPVLGLCGKSGPPQDGYKAAEVPL